MRKLLFALAWTVVSLGSAWGQCTGVFPANTLCGNLSGTAQPPRAFPSSGTVVGPGSSLFHGLPIWGNSAGTLLADGNGQSIPGVYTFLSATTFQGPLSATNNVQVGGTFIANGSSAISLSATSITISNGSGPVTLGGRTNTKNFNSLRYVAQYPGADWCAKLVAALADVGTNNTGVLVVDQTAGPAACSAASPISMTANKALYFVDGTDYILNQQIQVGIGTSIQGTGNGHPFVAPFVGGTTLKWTGANNTAMVKFYGASHSWMRDISLNCNATTGCINLWMNSNNTPSSSYNQFENLTFAGAHIGFLVGSTAATGLSNTTCNASPSIDGCSQNDNWSFANSTITNNCADATAVGVQMNSQNAAQLSKIERVLVQCANKAINLINYGGNFRLTDTGAGSTVGISPVFLEMHPFASSGLILMNNEIEGAWSLAISSSANQVFTATNGFYNNAFFFPVNIKGSSTIFSVGNTYGAGSVFGAAGGTVVTTSFNDVFAVGASATAGATSLFQQFGTGLFATIATLPACNNPRRGQKWTVSDSNTTTYNAVAISGGANTITVGCDGTNWRIGN